MKKKSAYCRKGLLSEIFRKEAESQNNRNPKCYNTAAMKKCTDCKKPSAILRSDYRKRNGRDQWETIIRPDEQCCPKCAAKRGARTLQQIHAER
jgi:hypothetical protein